MITSLSDFDMAYSHQKNVHGNLCTVQCTEAIVKIRGVSSIFGYSLRDPMRHEGEFDEMCMQNEASLQHLFPINNIEKRTVSLRWHPCMWALLYYYPPTHPSTTCVLSVPYIVGQHPLMNITC